MKHTKTKCSNKNNRTISTNNYRISVGCIYINMDNHLNISQHKMPVKRDKTKFIKYIINKKKKTKEIKLTNYFTGRISK